LEFEQQKQVFFCHTLDVKKMDLDVQNIQKHVASTLGTSTKAPRKKSPETLDVVVGRDMVDHHHYSSRLPDKKFSSFFFKRSNRQQQQRDHFQPRRKFQYSTEQQQQTVQHMQTHFRPKNQAANSNAYSNAWDCSAPNRVKCYKCLNFGHQQLQCALAWCNRCAAWGHTLNTCREVGAGNGGGNRSSTVDGDRRLFSTAGSMASSSKTRWRRSLPEKAYQ
jgi:hypothetical protein